MPNRIVREGILTSDKVDQLDHASEVFYRRLMSKVDDHGLYDARPSILRASLYPLRIDRVREADISRWIATCEKAGLIALYSHGDKPYLRMLNTNWQTRSEPKFPQPKAIANNCEQLTATAYLDVVVDVVVDDTPKPPQAGAEVSEFEVFWESYPRKIGKIAAQKAWKQTSKSRPGPGILVAAVEKQKASEQWQRDGGQFIPHPSTWLRQGRWLDEATNIPDPSAPSFEGDAPRDQYGQRIKIVT